jgi:membrane protease YdiL (CAAX protease family)
MNYLENVLGEDNSLWKYLTVCILTFVVMQLAGGIFLPYETGLSENFILMLMLIPFVVGMITIWLLIEKIHKRTFSITVNGRGSIRWNHVVTGFLVWFLLMSAYLGISYTADPDSFVMQFDGGKFIALLIITLLVIPFQTTFEEFVFRGYLAQGIAAWTKNRWLVICIPGLLFGLMHCQNTEISEHGFWITMPQYIIFGLFFGLIAVLDDGIELSIGMHTANNIFICLFVTNSASSLHTPAIFNQLTINPIAEIAGLLIAVSLATLFLYVKYKWNFHILNEKVEYKEPGY